MSFSFGITNDCLKRVEVGSHQTQLSRHSGHLNPSEQSFRNPKHAVELDEQLILGFLSSTDELIVSDDSNDAI